MSCVQDLSLAYDSAEVFYWINSAQSSKAFKHTSSSNLQNGLSKPTHALCCYINKEEFC